MVTEIHKYGTDDGWHGIIKEGGEFPPEKDRYHLYIGKLLHERSMAPQICLKNAQMPTQQAMA
jgi:hypothetical protein